MIETFWLIYLTGLFASLFALLVQRPALAFAKCVLIASIWPIILIFVGQWSRMVDWLIEGEE